jgi:hypothetical protein
MQRRIWVRQPIACLQEQVPTIAWGENRSECQQVKEMQLSWRQLQHELYNARDATLMLAVIAGFAAWIITQLLRAVLG